MYPKRAQQPSQPQLINCNCPWQFQRKMPTPLHQKRPAFSLSRLTSSQLAMATTSPSNWLAGEIGRASCRERGEIVVTGLSLGEEEADFVVGSVDVRCK